MAHRLVLVLERVPTDSVAEVVALNALVTYGGARDTVHWQIVDHLPAWVNVGMADQLRAHKRDAGPKSCYMIIMITSNVEAKELRTDGQAT